MESLNALSQEGYTSEEYFSKLGFHPSQDYGPTTQQPTDHRCWIRLDGRKTLAIEIS